MNILLISASTNDPSNSHTLAEEFLKGMQHIHACDVTALRLKDLHIEHFNLDYYNEETDQGEDFRRFQHAMESCDGFIVATPIWNFGVPAQMKNLIDRMGSFAFRKDRLGTTLDGKPFFCIFTGGAPLPIWKALIEKTAGHVPEALKYFGASYIGNFYEGKCTKGAGKFGLVVDERPDALAAVQKKGEEFAEVVKIYAETGKAPLKQRTMGTIAKWGEAVLKKIT